MIPQIGDFLTIALFAAKICQALDSSRGSKSEYHALLDTLKTFSQAMFQAEALCMEWYLSPGHGPSSPGKTSHRLDEVAEAIMKETKKCKALFEEFQRKFAPYSDAFEEDGKRHLTRQTFKKLTWIGSKELAERLEKELKGHMQALQLHLGIFYSEILKRDMADNKKLIQSVDSSMGALTTGMSGMALQMTKALDRLDFIQNRIPLSLGYGWGPEMPIILLEALGRTTHLPMTLVASPDTFRDVLMIMHRTHPGQDKIKSGKYGSPTKTQEARWFCGTNGLIAFSPADISVSASYSTTLVAPMRSDVPDAGRHRLGQPLSQISEDVQTLTEDEFAHPYFRVHYQRKTPCNTTARESRWDDANPSPEFEAFFAALPPLHRAASTGDVETVDDLLETPGADPNGG